MLRLFNFSRNDHPNLMEELFHSSASNFKSCFRSVTRSRQRTLTWPNTNVSCLLVGRVACPAKAFCNISSNPRSEFAEEISASQTKQCSHTPRRRHAERRHKGHTDHTIRRCAFAPALEHGNGSNEKQYDCNSAKNFQQHDPALLVLHEVTQDNSPTESCRRTSVHAVTLVTQACHGPSLPPTVHSPRIAAWASADTWEISHPLPTARKDRKSIHGPTRSAA